MSYSSSEPEALALGFTLPKGTDLIRNGDDAITANAKVATGAIRNTFNRLRALENRPAWTSSAPPSALERLRGHRAFASTSLTVAVVSDSTANDRSDWLRVWALKYGAPMASAMRRTYRDWDRDNNAWRAELVDNAGTAPDLGVVVDDDFSTPGPVVGSTPDSGPVWTGSAADGWTSNGTLATLSGGTVKTLSTNLGASDQTARVTFSLITTRRSPSSPLRFYAASSAGLSGGVWASLNISTSGALSVALYKTISGTSTLLQAATPVVGVTEDSATPQTVTVEVTTNIQNVAAKVTATNGQTTTLAGTITEADSSLLGHYAGVYGNPNAAYDYGYRLASFHGHTPAINNPVQPVTTAFHNGAIAGSKLSTFDAAKRAQMFAGLSPDVLIFAAGHNHGIQSPAGFVKEVSDFLDAWHDEHPSCAVLISSQNPQVAPAANRDAHRARQAALRVWAADRGHDYLPTFEAFAATSDGGASLIDSGGVHPTSTGSTFWADAAMSVLEG